MVNYYQSLVKKLNTRKQKPRYKAKRERRFFLTEAFIDGELALYKPAHIPYRLYTDIYKSEAQTTSNEGEGMEMIIDGNTVTIGKNLIPDEPTQPVKLTWFDKLILWIRKIWATLKK